MSIEASKNPLARSLAVAVLVAVAAGAEKTTTTPVSLLPPDLRARGRAIVLAADPGSRAELAGSLAEEEPRRASRFLAALLEREASADVRREIVDELGLHPSPDVRRALERRASADPDPGVSLLALDRLRRLDMIALRRLLSERRARIAPRDQETRRLLEQEDERWISLVQGSMLPSFLRRPPAPFSIRGGDSVRVLAFGDFGDGSDEQRRTANAMEREGRERNFDFGLTLGDNFYEEGMTSPEDPRWKSWWEDLYGPLRITFYGVLGNHDWKLPDSPASEVLYAARSDSWRMPSPYYTFTAGPVQFFALDTNEISDAQLDWLASSLAASGARWKVAYGHHPIHSAGHHGDTPDLVRRLLPVLRGRADVYLCGHDHDLQELAAEGGLHFFVAGGGGAETRPLHQDKRTVFGRAEHGFAVLEADRDSFSVTFIDGDGATLHRSVIRKAEAVHAQP